MRPDVKHNKYLDKLATHLDIIGESLRDIKWILKDGIWLRENEVHRRSLCDLICVYSNKAIPIEFKLEQNRSRAIQQINQGREFIEKELKLKAPYGKYVRTKDYITEVIKWG